MKAFGVLVNNVIKNEDIFGHQIVFNFNKDGDSHKTLLGGIGSFLVQSFMLFYIYLNFKKFYWNEADNNFTENGVIDLDGNPEYWDQKYSDMSMTIFQSMRFQRGGKGSVGSHNDHGIGELRLDDQDVLDKIKPYITVAYRYVETDWTVNLPNGKHEAVYVPAKLCNREDFGERPEGDEVYNAWKGYSLICPDLSSLEDQTWKFRGHMSSFTIKRGEFVIERCWNQDYCQSNQNINKFISDLQVDTWVFQEKIDYLKYNEKPVFKQVDFVDGQLLDHPQQITRQIAYLRKHFIDTEDAVFQIGQKSILDQFYRIGKVNSRPETAIDEQGQWKKDLFRFEYYLQPNLVAHKRVTYDLVALLGDMGGIQGILISILGILVVPISAHSFNIKAARKFFLARTSSKNMFEEIANEKKGKLFDEEMIASQSKRMQKEIRKHYIPKINLYDSIMLFFSTWFGRCFSSCGCKVDVFCCNGCFKQRRKLEKLYDATTDRFEDETNIIKIMKGLRDIKLLTKNSIMDKSMRFQIAHHVKNCIDLDSSQSEDSSSSTDNAGPETGRQLINGQCKDQDHTGATFNPIDISRNLQKSSKNLKKQKKNQEIALTIMSSKGLQRNQSVNQTNVQELTEEAAAQRIQTGFKKFLDKKCAKARAAEEIRIYQMNLQNSKDQQQ